MAILECTNQDYNGNPIDFLLNKNIPMKCWEGSHFIHAFFGIIATLIFCSICILVSLVFYTTNPADGYLAKTNPNADIVNLIVKFALILLFTFVNGSNVQLVLVVMMFALSVYQFYTYYKEMPYFVESMNTVKF
jgi:hypothetical protein